MCDSIKEGGANKRGLSKIWSWLFVKAASQGSVTHLERRLRTISLISLGLALLPCGRSVTPGADFALDILGTSYWIYVHANTCMHYCAHEWWCNVVERCASKRTICPIRGGLPSPDVVTLSPTICPAYIFWYSWPCISFGQTIQWIYFLTVSDIWDSFILTACIHISGNIRYLFARWEKCCKFCSASFLGCKNVVYEGKRDVFKT